MFDKIYGTKQTKLFLHSLSLYPGDDGSLIYPHFSGHLQSFDRPLQQFRSYLLACHQKSLEYLRFPSSLVWSIVQVRQMILFKAFNWLFVARSLAFRPLFSLTSSVIPSSQLDIFLVVGYNQSSLWRQTSSLHQSICVEALRPPPTNSWILLSLDLP